MTEPARYSLPGDLLQAIVNVLNEQPARITRALLNAIEAECIKQDQARMVAPRGRRKTTTSSEEGKA